MQLPCFQSAGTFLTSLVSMQRSIRSTVEMSIYSRHMSFIHLVKLSTVVWKSSQVNFIMLKTRLMMLSLDNWTEDRKGAGDCEFPVLVLTYSSILILLTRTAGLLVLLSFLLCIWELSDLYGRVTCWKGTETEGTRGQTVVRISVPTLHLAHRLFCFYGVELPSCIFSKICVSLCLAPSGRLWGLWSRRDTKTGEEGASINITWSSGRKNSDQQKRE